MDRSLDEIISDRPERSARGGRRPEPRRGPSSRGPRRDEYPRDGVQKYRRNEPANIDADWVHDRFEDDRYDRRPRAPAHDDRHGPPSNGTTGDGTKIRVDNVHYDLTEEDLRGLFEQKGPTRSVQLLYDRMDRSRGIAFVVFEDARDARRAIDDFDGCNAKGQPIRLTLAPNNPRGGGRGEASLFDRMDRPERSLFDRITSSDNGDRRRRPRSASPRRAGPPSDRGDRRGGRGSRSPTGRRGTPVGGRREQGRRPGARRDEGGRGGKRDGEGRSGAGGRARKTAQELDAEMDDYFNKPGDENGHSSNGAGPTNGADAGDDVDMVT